MKHNSCTLMILFTFIIFLGSCGGCLIGGEFTPPGEYGITETAFGGFVGAIITGIILLIISRLPDEKKE